jgi:hypothetical protein
MVDYDIVNEQVTTKAGRKGFLGIGKTNVIYPVSLTIAPKNREKVRNVKIEFVWKKTTK